MPRLEAAAWLLLLGCALAEEADGDDAPKPNVCEVKLWDAETQNSMSEATAQGMNLTEKLWLDLGCFAVGLVVAAWGVLRRSILGPLWRDGLRASCRAVRLWCYTCCKTVQCCCCGRSHARFSGAGGNWAQDKPLAFTNYFRYLGTCCITFPVLYLVSQGLAQLFRIEQLIPVDASLHGKDTAASLLLQSGSIFSHVNSETGDAIFGWVLSVVLTNGVVLLVATYLLERWCDQPEVHEKVSRAIWVHGLPVKDQRLNPLVNEHFRLTFEELKQVERELGARFNDELHQLCRRQEDGRNSGMGKGLANRNRPNAGPQRRQARYKHRQSGTFDIHGNLAVAAPFLATEDEGEWVVDDWDAHLQHHQRQKPSEGLYVGNHIGAKGIFKADDGRAVFVRKVLAASRVENVWVVPAARHWIEASERLEDAFNQLQVYRLWLLAYQHPAKASMWESAWKRWYQLRSRATELAVARLEDRLLHIRLKRLRMCGSAFVLFREVDDAQRLLGSAPKWWHCQRWMCWFNLLKFGHVPFTSVTLEYEPAPHPDDMNWENMDTPRWFSETVFLILTFFLMFFMLAGQALFMWILSLTPYGDQVSQHFASLMLLFINRSILPFPVEWIALAAKFRRRTEVELRQMHLNFWLLAINTIVVPLLGLQIAQQIPLEFKKDPFRFLWCVSFRLLRLPKRLFVGYLFDVTFLTNLYQVLAGSLFSLAWDINKKLTATLPPNVSVLPADVVRDVLGRQRARQRAFDAPPQSARRREKDASPTPPQYAFGYYYAWTLSIIALALLTSAEVPVTLVITGLCFIVKAAVDWYNLRNGVYEIGPEHEGVLITWAIFYMRLCVSGWWFMTGMGVGQLCGESRDTKCPDWVNPMSTALITFAAIVLGMSFFRISYAIATRRFFPGRQKYQGAGRRQKCKDACLTWDAAPRVFYSNQEAPALAEERRPSYTTFSEAFGDLEAPRRSETKCRPAFANIEAVVEEVHDRPFLEEFVQRFLAEGLSVQEVLTRIRKAELRRRSGSDTEGAFPAAAFRRAYTPPVLSGLESRDQQFKPAMENHPSSMTLPALSPRLFRAPEGG